MPLSYREVTQPTVEPVSLAIAKQHLRVDFDADDDYISGLVSAARQYVEKITNRAIFSRSMLLTLDYFPWPGWNGTSNATGNQYISSYYRGLCIRLPKPSCIAVQSLTYLANDGVTEITIDPANYIVDTNSEPARISPAPGYTWPYQTNFVPGQVRVAYTAGTYTPANCPQTIIAAMLLIIGHLYEHRSENTELALKTLPLGVEYLLAGEVFETLDWNQ